MSSPVNCCPEWILEVLYVWEVGYKSLSAFCCASPLCFCHGCCRRWCSGRLEHRRTLTSCVAGFWYCRAAWKGRPFSCRPAIGPRWLLTFGPWTIYKYPIDPRYGAGLVEEVRRDRARNMSDIAFALKSCDPHSKDEDDQRNFINWKSSFIKQWKFNLVNTDRLRRTWHKILFVYIGT